MVGQEEQLMEIKADLTPYLDKECVSWKRNVFDPEYWQKHGFDPKSRDVLYAQARVAEYPGPEHMVSIEIPEFFSEMIRKSADFIFDQQCALRCLSEDWGHGHIFITKAEANRFGKLKEQLESLPLEEKDKQLAQFLINHCQAILWHTQEEFDKKNPNYPLDKKKRNIFIRKGQKPKIVHPVIPLPDRFDPYQTVFSDGLGLGLSTKISLVDILQFEVRENPNGQIQTKRGKILAFVPVGVL